MCLHLHDEAPGDGDRVIVTQVESLKQLTANRKHVTMIRTMTTMIRKHDNKTSNLLIW